MAKRRKGKPQQASSTSSASRPVVPPPDPPTAGGCAVAFFGLLAAVVTVVFATIAWGMLGPTWEVRQRFVETTGEIVSARIREVEKEGGHYAPELLVRFTPGGQPRREVWANEIPPRTYTRHPAAWEVLDRRPVGAIIPCWYDPADPGQVTLDHGWDRAAIVVLAIPLAVLAVVLYCLRHAWRRWGLSPEAAAQGGSGVHYICLLAGGMLLLLGMGLFSSLVFDTIVPEHRAAHSYVETTCVVLDSRMLRFSGKTTSYRPEFKIRYQTPAFPDPVETWVYRASDANAKSSRFDELQAKLASFEKGKTYPCWYDPARPRWVVLDRSMSWSTYLLAIVPVVLLVPAGLLLAYSIRGLREPSVREIDSATGSELRAFPPAATPAAGRRLSYRCTARGSRWREFWQFVAFTVGWNVIAWIFATAALANRMQGRPEWFLTIFSGFLVLMGVLILVATVSKFFAALRFPPAVLELSLWPLQPGSSFQFQATQGGPQPPLALVVKMVCDESTTFTVGSTARVETARVFSCEILRREGGAMANPCEVEGTWTVPHQAMHSFKSGRSSITWKVVIEARFSASDMIETEIPVLMRPKRVG